jgi:GT2 family glycosyltransferase
VSADDREAARLVSGTLKIAVVIVNYNGGILLERCLSALTGQAYGSFRTIVVDNASSDGSADGIETHHPEVRVIRLPRNIGFAASNNAGIKAAEGSDWIACLNPDAFPEPDWLAQFVRAAERTPEKAFFGCRMLQAEDPQRLDGTGDIYHVSGLAWRRDHRAPVAQGVQEAGEIFAPCAAAALYPRDALLEVGGFDESYFCYFEDIDLAFRLRLRGYRCWYVPEAVVHHMGSAITGRRSDFSLYQGHRNLVWTFFKDMPGPLLWLYLPQHLLLNLVTILVFAFRGKTRVILSAKWDAIRQLGRIFRERKAVQSSRRTGIADLRRAMTTGFLAPYVRWRG